MISPGLSQLIKDRSSSLLRVSMKNNEKRSTVNAEFRINGLFTEEGIRIQEKESVDELSSKGYGVADDHELLLAFYEALYLLGKETLEVKYRNNKKMDFQSLLQRYESAEEDAWAKYLAYRDLRSRGYVVRGGFGLGVDFRVYDRGEYRESPAKFLVLSMQEGKPVTVKYLTQVLKHCQSLKKELVLAVMNRRGEIVYYSVSQLTLK